MPTLSPHTNPHRTRSKAPTKAFREKVGKARNLASDAVLALRTPEGYWWAELESNVTITAEYLMLHRFLGLPQDKIPGLVREILSQQLENGGWSLWDGDGGELSTSVEAYQALKMAGLPAEDPRLLKARQFILKRDVSQEVDAINVEKREFIGWVGERVARIQCSGGRSTGLAGACAPNDVRINSSSSQRFTAGRLFSSPQ